MDFNIKDYSRNYNDLTRNNSLGKRGTVMKDVKSQGKPGGLNAEIQSRIGHQLRAMYDDVVRQGVPDRFAELIRKLDQPGDKTDKPDGRD
jgi:hypothetical protein